MKWLNIFFILLFLYSAIVQYNDPDPYLWMPIYLFGAALCFFAVQKKFNTFLYAAGITGYAVYACILFFSSTGVLSWINDHSGESIVQTMEADKPWIEETREFLGLMLLIAALTANWFYSVRLKKQESVQTRTT